MMNVPHIDSYKFGQIVIDGKIHKKDVIILPHEVIAGWWRKEGHLLQLADLQEVLEVKPEALIVGRGASSQMRVPFEVQEQLINAGIELVSLPTQEACQEYNQRSQTGSIAAALHLTC
jgi:hypothetical protein